MGAVSEKNAEKIKKHKKKRTLLEKTYFKITI